MGHNTRLRIHMLPLIYNTFYNDSNSNGNKNNVDQFSKWCNQSGGLIPLMRDTFTASQFHPKLNKTHTHTLTIGKQFGALLLQITALKVDRFLTHDSNKKEKLTIQFEIKRVFSRPEVY